MDFFSRRIVGWSLDTQMTVALGENALAMAFDRRGITPGLIVHSDRDVQYRSQQYVDYLATQGMTASKSRKGNCWDTQYTALSNTSQVWPVLGLAKDLPLRWSVAFEEKAALAA